MAMKAFHKVNFAEFVAAITGEQVAQKVRP